MRHAAPRLRGFSLIEVLVALFILALMLGVASQAIATWLRTGQRQSETLRAQLCADNALNELRLRRTMPGIGVSTSVCEQGGQVMQVLLDVKTTPNPAFFRVDASVSAGQQSVLRLTSIVGRY